MTDKKRLALFGGTTEGRLLAERLAALSVRADVFAATEYGAEGLPVSEGLTVCCGRLDAKAMEKRFKEQGYALVLDATHPYACEVSRNIRTAADAAGVELWRVLRERTETAAEGVPGEAAAGEVMPGEAAAGEAVSGESVPGKAAAAEAVSGETAAGEIEVESVDEAVSFLKHTEGKILAATGSKELAKYKALPGWESRVYARVLPLARVMEECARLGFAGKRLIAMQGPFSQELNTAMLRETGAKWLVTKESGKEGGFAQKRAAAKEAGAGLVVIGRPKEEGIPLSEALERLSRRFGAADAPTDFLKPASAAEAPPLRHIWLVGMGPGNPSLVTGAAREALCGCDLIAGAGRLAGQAAAFGKPFLKEYRPERILSYLSAHPEYTRIAVIFSGDTGFYSGAKRLYEALHTQPGFQVEVLPGISSMNYFFSCLGKSWEHVKLLSLHGQTADFVGALREHGKVFLLGGREDVLQVVCRELTAADLGNVHITVGEELSLPGERIFEGSPETLRNTEVRPLSVLLLEREGETAAEAPVSSPCGFSNPETAAEAPVSSPCRFSNPETAAKVPAFLTHGLPDTAFVRGDVPMTKMEVRAVSIAKLGLAAGAVLYDIGAGTGSVAVECARLSKDVTIYAIEQNEKAVELLEENRRRFGLSNLTIIPGRAPGALLELPPASHVFIGGSGGELKEILKSVLLKNPKTRIVMNVIMPETLTALFEAVKELPGREPELVCLTVARSKKAGRGHLMMGQNPVWIVSL